MDTIHIFSERLKQVVEIKKKYFKKSQNQIAKDLGISTGALSNYLAASAEPKIVFCAMASEYFGVSADWLLGISDVKSVDVTRKEICKSTGLPEDAVQSLIWLEEQHKMKLDKFQKYSAPSVGDVLGAMLRSRRVIDFFDLFGKAVDGFDKTQRATAHLNSTEFKEITLFEHEHPEIFKQYRIIPARRQSALHYFEAESELLQAVKSMYRHWENWSKPEIACNTTATKKEHE